MADNLQITIWCPEANTGKTGAELIPDLVIDATPSGKDFVVVTELGQVEFDSLLPNGQITLKQGAAQARLYTINLGGTADQLAVLDYLRILQLRGDSSDSIDAQLGNIYYRDEFYRLDPADLINYRTSYGTPLVVGPRSLVFHEAPCYLLFDGAWKRILGQYGASEAENAESADFAILERINALSTEATSNAGTVQISFSGFSVSFSQFTGNIYPRQPETSQGITYSIAGAVNRTGPSYSPKKQIWPLDCELADAELLTLQRLLAAHEANPASISLADYTLQFVEATPRTHAIASGSATTSGSTVAYWAQFNVEPRTPLVVSSKGDGSNSKVIRLELAETEATTP